MTYDNSDLKYAECDFCGQEKECFIQYEFDGKHVVCPDCFCTADFD